MAPAAIATQSVFAPSESVWTESGGSAVELTGSSADWSATESQDSYGGSSVSDWKKKCAPFPGGPVVEKVVVVETGVPKGRGRKRVSDSLDDNKENEGEATGVGLASSRPKRTRKAPERDGMVETPA
ncbi:hypothetical protein LTR17_008581 [Elasticomyces elasticus]|nr:hypothetical protein LTR17_008581 [Elasticomyces elasticus]